MGVGDLQREVEALAIARGLEIRRGDTFDWLSGLGHAEPAAQNAPPEVLERLAQIHAALGGDDTRLRGKRRQPAPVDFTLPGSTIIELDEIQHFTSARRHSLDLYESIEHNLDVDRYRELCGRYSSEADRYRRTKEARDFPFPGGRSAQRAYLDAVRDLMAPAFGHRVIRIPAIVGGADAAVAELIAALT